MPKRPPKPATPREDVNQAAFRIVAQATGQLPSPPPPPKQPTARRRRKGKRA